MPAQIIDGRAVAGALQTDLRTRAEELRQRGVSPRLVVSLVGEDPASVAYLRNLKRTGERVAIDVVEDVLPEGATEDALVARLDALGRDMLVHGIIVQQPLPANIGLRRVVEAIPAAKDVDGASSRNQGLLTIGDPHAFVPATPAAIMILLEHSPAWPLEGKRALVVGRSRVVGLPTALLILARNATVTIAHRYTRDLDRALAEAEVIVAATGIPGLIRGSAIRPGATIIDAGTTFVDGVLKGDADYASVSEVAGAITPVPGGVGPVTNMALMRNVIDAAART